jgi:ABC-2 type transport system ATP-binding protein
MEEAEYCDRLALMNRGRLIALDAPAALRAGMREPLYSLATPEPIAALAALDAAPEVVRAGLFGRDLHVTLVDRERAPAALLDRLATAGVAAGALAEIAPSLEDVFVALVDDTGGAREDG